MKTFEDDKIKLFEEIYQTCNQQLREWDVDEKVLQEGLDPLYIRTGSLMSMPTQSKAGAGAAGTSNTVKIDNLIDIEIKKGTPIDTIINKIMYKFGGSHDKIKSYIESRNNLKESLEDV